MKGNLNFLSWNVKGLNHPVKRNRVFSHLKNLRAGIAFLQETHLRDSDQWRLGKGWAGQVFHSNFKGKARGVAILVDKNMPFEHSNIMADKFGVISLFQANYTISQLS